MNENVFSDTICFVVNLHILPLNGAPSGKSPFSLLLPPASSGFYSQEESLVAKM
jgi:hypothetical protein